MQKSAQHAFIIENSFRMVLILSVKSQVKAFEWNKNTYNNNNNNGITYNEPA